MEINLPEGQGVIKAVGNLVELQVNCGGEWITYAWLSRGSEMYFISDGKNVRYKADKSDDVAMKVFYGS